MHNELAAYGDRWINQVRSLAMDVGRDAIWIEKVAVRTRPCTTIDMEAEGPLREIAQYIGELQADNRAMAEIMEDFNGLRRKLPEQLANAERLRALYDVEAMRDLLGEVEPLLVGQLREGGS